MRTALFTSIILLLPIIPLINCSFIYYSNFNKYQVYDNFESPQVAKEEARNMLAFVQLKSTTLNAEFFSEEDVKHLYDVRLTIIIFYLCLITICALFLKSIYKVNIEEKITIINKSLSIALITLLSFFTVGLFFFGPFLLIFHKIIFFYNDYWLLDPKSSNLIKYFPEEIFNNTLFLYVGIIFFEVILLKIFAIIANNRWKASSSIKK